MAPLTWRDVIAITWRRVALLLVSVVALFVLVHVAAECDREPAPTMVGRCK